MPEISAKQTAKAVGAKLEKQVSARAAEIRQAQKKIKAQAKRTGSTRRPAG